MPRPQSQRLWHPPHVNFLVAETVLPLYDSINSRKQKPTKWGRCMELSILHLLILLVIAVVPYFAPTIIAVVRKKRNAGAIAVLNIFLGWTVVGWVVALVWALSVDAPAVTVTNISNYPSTPAPGMSTIHSNAPSGPALFCQGCGARLGPDARFCASCGRHIG